MIEFYQELVFQKDEDDVEELSDSFDSFGTDNSIEASDIKSQRSSKNVTSMKAPEQSILRTISLSSSKTPSRLKKSKSLTNRTESLATEKVETEKDLLDQPRLIGENLPRLI